MSINKQIKGAFTFGVYKKAVPVVSGIRNMFLLQAAGPVLTAGSRAVRIHTQVGVDG